MLGVPEDGFVLVEELPDPTLPVAAGEPLPLVLPEPTVPVVRGTPALPTPVPKFGVTVVLPGPGPPGTPTPDVLPGWPPAAPPGAVLLTLPLEVPVPPELPLVPPPCARAIVEHATRSVVASTGERIRMGASSAGRWVNDSREAAFRSYDA